MNLRKLFRRGQGRAVVELSGVAPTPPLPSPEQLPPISEFPTYRAQRNIEGLTWREWKAAAGILGSPVTDVAGPILAWINGEDPTEYRVNPQLRPVGEDIDTPPSV